MSSARRDHAPRSRLSSTDSGANSCRPSGTWVMPRATRTWLGNRSIAVSSKRIEPAVTGWTPEMARNSVVLPAPLAPTRLTISPRPTVSETPCSTSMRPYALLRFSTDSTRVLRVGAEIGLDHCRVLADLGGAAFRQRAAMGQDMDAVGDRHDEAHVVLDQYHGHAVAHDRPDHPLDVH